jgi:hypothetical protein
LQRGELFLLIVRIKALRWVDGHFEEIEKDESEEEEE